MTASLHSPHDRSRDVSALAQSGWDGRVGMFSELIFFWLPTIGVLRLDLAAMDWAEKVFPGMGYD